MAIAQVIRYEGDNTTFVWKHPVEDFHTGSQLIVHESQEAVFFLNGQALDLFGAGRHTLETENIPLLTRLFELPFGRQTPFHCEAYFVNRAEQMAIKWGTDSKVEYMEPTYNFPLAIGASGEMSLRAGDARKLLVKLIGTEHGATQQALVQKFRGVLMTRIKTYLANLIREKRINIFAIDEHLTAMSEDLRAKLVPDFEEYGVALEKFFVTTIVKPEEDRAYQRFKELHFRQYADVAEAQLRQQVGVIEQQTEAQRMVIEAQSLAQKRALEGYTYREERGFDVAERVAANEGVGQMSNLGIGLGVMSGVGTAVGGTVGGIANAALGGVVQSAADGREMLCPHCGQGTRRGKFCMQCGQKLPGNCPNCGSAIPEGGKFCLECGQKL